MSEEYLGDLEKTSIIAELFEIPKDERDENWIQTFFDNVADASFCCCDPQVMKGPDGFSYFNLILPEPGVEFECYVVRELMPLLLERGLGVALASDEDNTEWVFSAGDILELSLTGEFNLVEKKSHEDRSEAEKEVLIAQPSESFLPKQTRSLLRTFLISQGYQNPRILTMLSGGDSISNLVFDFKEIENNEKVNDLLYWISWYLPRNYSISGTRSGEFDANFQNL